MSIASLFSTQHHRAQIHFVQSLNHRHKKTVKADHSAFAVFLSQSCNALCAVSRLANMATSATAAAASKYQAGAILLPVI